MNEIYFILFLFIESSIAIDPITTLECHRRQYSYKVQQTDANDRTCWDHVNVMSCWGRCDSNEIADWKFPYKRSYHPVCLHDSTQEKTVYLRNCDADADLKTQVYKFQEAASCACTFCKSSEASCEGLRYRGARRAPKISASKRNSKISTTDFTFRNKLQNEAMNLDTNDVLELSSDMDFKNLLEKELMIRHPKYLYFQNLLKKSALPFEESNNIIHSYTNNADLSSIFPKLSQSVLVRKKDKEIPHYESDPE